MIEFLIEIIIRGLIIRFFGINTRYLYFKIIGKNVSKAELSTLESKDTTQIMESFFIIT